jgi:hypothetical protein
MNTNRPRPFHCENPAFPCRCRAKILNRNVGRWFCSYCTSQNYNVLNRCSRPGCTLPGRCVNKDTGDWYCGEEHGHQCDILVPRPEGCGWPARRLPCSQIAWRTHEDRQWICEDHFVEYHVGPGHLAFRALPRPFDSANSPVESSHTPLGTNSEWIDLNRFSAALDSVDSLLNGDCPICRTPKIQWRRLGVCGHELCDDCLREQMRSSLQNKFLCPFDRRPLFDFPL